MKLSIVIVNYNVKHFLEQCLYSVFNATKNIDAEVFVVDNNSVDGSVAMIKEKFPKVKLIANTQNTGFSKANNQAIKQANGQYILLLNPDTLVEEDSFEKIIDFMDKTPDAGGLGVKMIDGSGNFLPESKRALPTPAVAFYKIFGLSKLFPKSKKFGKYHLTYLDNNKINEVEILSGAFMLLRKTVIDKIGMLDETFFMYGEDIDLSYRIILAGYKNYYFPNTTIIHYKGESTKKGSINYVRIFYKAMIIFAQKHFSNKNAGIFIFLINFAIYLRAAIALLMRFIKSLILPSIDATVIYGSFLTIKYLWENFYFSSGYFHNEILNFTIFGFIAIWIISLYFAGGYDKPVKLKLLLNGLIAGAILNLMYYALLPESLRFSRFVTGIGTISNIFTVTATRYLLSKTKLNLFKLSNKKSLKFIIVASKQEAKKISNVLSKNIKKPEIIGYVDTNKNETSGNILGNIEQLNEIAKIHQADEIIFSAKCLPAQEIIKNIISLSVYNLTFRIASPDSLTVVGSKSLDSQGDLYSLDFNAITKPVNMRLKQSFDKISALIFLILYPILIWLVKNKIKFLKNIFLVLAGNKSWVGFKQNNTAFYEKLPKIKSGIISIYDIYKSKQKINNEQIDRLNLNYARDYKIINDFMIIFKAFKHLGN